MLGVSASGENASCLQSDVLAGLWQDLQEAAAAVAEEDDDEDFSETDKPPQHQQRAAAQDAAMVGPTTAELESIKELIQFDHEYIKPVQVPIKIQTNNKKSTNHADAIAAVPANNAKSAVVKCNSNKPKKMVSVVNFNISANCQPKQIATPVKNQQPTTPVTSDTGLDLPEFFETEDILDFNCDLIKDIDIDHLLNGGIIDNVIPPADVGKQQKQHPISSIISQDNPRKRKCSDVDSSTANCSVKQTKLDDFCLQTVVKFDDIFSQSDETKSDSVISELSEAGSPASVTSLSSSSHDDLWEESFSELFPTLV